MAKYRVSPMRGHSYIVEAADDIDAAAKYARTHEISGVVEVHVFPLESSYRSFNVFRNEQGEGCAQLKKCEC